MKNLKPYIEHSEKAAQADSRFEHVMAIALNSKTNYREGVVRCVLSLEGDISVDGFIARSALYKASRDSLEHITVNEKVIIKNQKEIIGNISRESGDFLGLEDPDIWIDEKTDLMHVYFTLPIKYETAPAYSINLGHAVGKNLDSLEMTEPVLIDKGHDSAKELSIAPINTKGVRYNLIESSESGKHFAYSTVRIAIAHDMGKSWEYGKTLFNPENHSIPWVGGHASPGPFLPKSFINVGDNKLLGFLNGREANQIIHGKTKFGMFSIGLFIYDYEYGKIDWVSPEPFLIDSEAITITFASQFVETGKGKGVLYATVDDSFIRAYDLDADQMKIFLSKSI